MGDLLYLLGTMAFFATMARYAHAIRRLGDRTGTGPDR